MFAVRRNEGSEIVVQDLNASRGLSVIEGKDIHAIGCQPPLSDVSTIGTDLKL